MTRQPKSALRVLIEDRLAANNQGLAELVTYDRNSGDSWQTIADDIHDLTGVRVTGESLRNWFGETEPADTSA